MSDKPRYQPPTPGDILRYRDGEVVQIFDDREREWLLMQNAHLEPLRQWVRNLEDERDALRAELASAESWGYQRAKAEDIEALRNDEAFSRWYVTTKQKGNLTYGGIAADYLEHLAASRLATKEGPTEPCSTCDGTGEVHCGAHIAGDGRDNLVLPCPACVAVRPAPSWTRGATKEGTSDAAGDS